MVQVNLGGVELPNDKEFGHLKRQLACEKTAVFDRLNRLVRCVVDCKAFDGDGPGTRVGLELARAIAAGSWENKPFQLSQIPGFGPVMVRKWISLGVRTVLGVAGRDYMEIERISGRNPPYGKNLLKTLESFPRLTLRAEILETAKHNSPQSSIAVTVKANLGHCNTKRSPNWGNKSPSLTFLVEVSDGSLSYFWRANIKKVDQPNGLDLKFPVLLSGPRQTISCYFSCEEIVGTQIIKTLEPDIPSSAFIDAGVIPRCREPPKADLLDSDADLDDVDDADMLEVLDSADTSSRQPPAEKDQSLLGDSDDYEFHSIEDILAHGSSQETAPQKMDNGKWMCQHNCRNGGPTKSGKPCSHRCCREGVDKPRPPPTRKKAKATVGDDGIEEEPQSARDSPTKQTQSRKPGGTSSVSRRGNSPSGLSQPALGSRVGTKHKLAKAMTENSPRKRQTLYHRTQLLNIPSDVDCIDLSTEPCGPGMAESTEVIERSIMGSQNRNENPGEPHGHLHQDPVKPIVSKEHLDRNPEQVPTRTPLHGNSMLENDKNWSDNFSDDDEFPNIDDLIRIKESCDASASAKLQEMAKSDETLYPGVVQTLKKSIDSGVESNLSFTTVDELHKASNRLGISNTSSELLSSKSQDGTPYLEPTTRMLDMCNIDQPGATPSNDNVSASDVPSEFALATDYRDQPLFLNPDPAELSSINEYVTGMHTQQDRPSWMSEYDAKDIALFRGDFHFVD